MCEEQDKPAKGTKVYRKGMGNHRTCGGREEILKREKATVLKVSTR